MCETVLQAVYIYMYSLVPVWRRISNISKNTLTSGSFQKNLISPGRKNYSPDTVLFYTCFLYRFVSTKSCCWSCVLSYKLYNICENFPFLTRWCSARRKSCYTAASSLSGRKMFPYTVYSMYFLLAVLCVLTSIFSSQSSTILKNQI